MSERKDKVEAALLELSDWLKKHDAIIYSIDRVEIRVCGVRIITDDVINSKRIKEVVKNLEDPEDD